MESLGTNTFFRYKKFFVLERVKKKFYFMNLGVIKKIIFFVNISYNLNLYFKIIMREFIFKYVLCIRKSKQRKIVLRNWFKRESFHYFILSRVPIALIHP